MSEALNRQAWTPKVSLALTGRPISVLLELPEEVDHALVKVLCDKLLMIVACKRRDELDDCSSHQVFAVIFVGQHLVTDFIVPLLHELKVAPNIMSHDT